MKALILLFFLSISFAIPSCPYYPYNDHSFWNSYSSPSKPSDTLLSYCDWSLDPTCLFTALIDNNEEKKLFIAESIAANSFENIDSWNRNLDFGSYAPDNASTGNSYTIKDAWIDIISIDPSVYEEDNLLVNKTGDVLTKHGFSFVVQNKRRSRDCRVEYSVCGYDYSLDTYIDGAKINSGNSQQASFEFSGSSESTITSTLSVNSEYLVDHYHKVMHCVRTMFGSHCWWSCDYYETEEVRDSLTLTDSKDVYYDNETNNVNYILDDVRNGLADFWLNIEGNDSNVNLQIGNANFDKTNYFYKIRYENEPYNTLTKEIVPLNETETYAFSILESKGNGNNLTIHLIAPYSEDCELTVNSHFDQDVYSDICNLNRPKAEINLTVMDEDENKLRIIVRLHRNDTNAPLAGKEILIFHSNQEYSIKTNGEGEAELLIDRTNNVVTAEFQTDFETRSTKESIVVEAKKPAIFESITNMFSLGIVAYLLYLPAKKLMVAYV